VSRGSSSSHQLCLYHYERAVGVLIVSDDLPMWVVYLSSRRGIPALNFYLPAQKAVRCVRSRQSFRFDIIPPLLAWQ
jgi:hypothetical protein